jgi:hypothetical protein
LVHVEQWSCELLKLLKFGSGQLRHGISSAGRGEEWQKLVWGLYCFYTQHIGAFLAYLFIYSYVHTLFGPCSPPSSPPITSRQNLFSSPILLKRRHKQ